MLRAARGKADQDGDSDAEHSYSTAYRSWAHADDPPGFPRLAQQQLTALLAAAQSMVSSHPPEGR